MRPHTWDVYARGWCENPQECAARRILRTLSYKFVEYVGKHPYTRNTRTRGQQCVWRNSPRIVAHSRPSPHFRGGKTVVLVYTHIHKLIARE